VDRITRPAIGAVLAGASELAPGVATAVVRLLEYYEIPLAGRRAAVVGRSRGVGKPVALLMLARDATVIMCHSRTRDLADVTSQADVLVACVGHPGLITRDHVKPGAVVIDVGATYTADGLRGDVDADGVAQVASAYSPVPGGIGPLTVYCLLENLLSLTREAQGG
jgi:methylenetetrahydrofolate dehydrogenase (NADP+)/methenyltetrahydrofolate cyclohydrolase